MIRGGEEIEILDAEEDDNAFPPLPENIPLDILFEDEEVIVINKQRGIVVHPGCGHWSGTIVNGLLFHYGHSLPSVALHRPGIVHRLDKDTSGAMVIAKTEEALKALLWQFSTRRITKTYICLCKNRFPYQSFIYKSNIQRHSTNRKKMSVHLTKGKESETQFSLLYASSEASMLKCRPISGRTHQIRVHLAHLGYPIIGDPLYGKGVRKYAFPMLLHSYGLKFLHPKKEKIVEIFAPLPQDFKEALEFFYGKNQPWKDQGVDLQVS
ncbi:Pseudouridine synthase [Methylacidiphilum fumariolicum SolV]|uniref:Pseudouridine synthase n=2 Tax=Candidatus Methylacidiphilum fumarolicum TaxID=591154 RepID=I0JW96_METFB|nr:RluA family pseudouridine synthase [Candidatus Methylacidiphilum fumarolicum]CAI9085707.1 Ribosomal large subunit pseudouridine synthase D [Candidatus Methylacidiphilum fumarolicum]CCG91515.1 Pseudouridine synthase [Methylacidiphilum fumariolicum SolV]